MAEPIIFLKSGLIEAEPSDFCEELAERYSAETIDTESIRHELFGDSHSRSSKVVEAVNNGANRRAMAALESGSNVVYDSLLNTRARRERLREEVIRPTGATCLLLVIQTPINVVKARINGRYKKGNPIVVHGRQKSIGGAINYTNKSLEYIEWPDDDESPLILDGRRTTIALVRRVSEHVGAMSIS